MPFETLCRMAFSIPYNLLLIVPAMFFITGTSQLLASAIHCCQSVRRSVLHGRFQMSFASSFSVQHCLVSCICSLSQVSFSCRGSVIRFSLYCHRKRVPFAWRRLSTRSRGCSVCRVLSTISPNCFATWKRSKAIFPTAPGRWMRAALIYPASYPLRMF